MKLFVDGREIAGVPGERLLDAAQRAGLPLEGTCGGDMACATCHVVIDPADMARVPPPGEDEDDMLDLVPLAGPGSRLACQIRLCDGLNHLSFRLPDGSRKLQLR